MLSYEVEFDDIICLWLVKLFYEKVVMKLSMGI